MNATPSFLSLLESSASRWRSRAEAPYLFRGISTEQATPYTVAFAKWLKNGESGPQPTASPAEIRAAIYDQATSASQLRAFSKVASVAAVELAEAVIGGLKTGQIIIAYTALRGLIERIAHLAATNDALRMIKESPIDGPMVPVLELSDVIHKSLSGTTREWKKLVNADFRTVPVSEVKYVPKENIANPQPANILKSIDKLERRVAGTRLIYEILCEFLHPNIGDLWGATLEATATHDRFGTRHVIRTLGLGSKTLKGLPDQQKLYSKLQDVCSGIVLQMDVELAELDIIAARATQLTRRFAHNVVRQQRQYFADSDLCPCLSGKTVTGCTGLRGR